MRLFKKKSEKVTSELFKKPIMFSLDAHDSSVHINLVSPLIRTERRFFYKLDSICTNPKLSFSKSNEKKLPDILQLSFYVGITYTSGVKRPDTLFEILNRFDRPYISKIEELKYTYSIDIKEFIKNADHVIFDRKNKKILVINKDVDDYVEMVLAFDSVFIENDLNYVYDLMK